MNLIKNYYTWLHGQWPAGTVERLPQINEDFTTSIPGVYVVGDLTGIPLLKLAADSGARAIQHISKQISTENDVTQNSPDHQVVIIGGGVSGYAAALEAKKHGLAVLILEAQTPFSTIENFPTGKPIYTYPTELTPSGELRFEEQISVREELLAELKQKVAEAEIPFQTARATHVERNSGDLSVQLDDGLTISAQYVIVAIGRSGKYRALDIPGESLDKVVNRLHDPKTYRNRKLLVVGGGDSAIEAAIACAEAGAEVTLSYRKATFSRPKPVNLERLDDLLSRESIRLLMASQVRQINPESVAIQLADKTTSTIDNDNVLTLIGREAPLDFFRRSQLPIQGESTWWGWVFFAAFVLAMIGLYDWKNFGFLNSYWSVFNYPDQMPALISGWSEWWQQQVNDRSTLISTIAVSMKSRSFYYTLLYTSCIGVFGWQRVRRRKTPYVKVQTTTLFLIQLIPLFILPEIILPLLGYNGVFDAGWLKAIADSLFPSYISAAELAAGSWPEWGHPRAYWHAYGLILAWPLNVYNVFTPTPMAGWLIISAIQTFVIIPVLVYKYGKGAYCGWICSCGALAETMGDTQRQKMPRGPFWNKVNMLGQVLLLVAIVLLVIRILGWIFPDSWMHTAFDLLLKGEDKDYQLVNPVSWKWTVDVLLGGIIGVGFYFKYSARVWCRFACPLAALMNIYTRFSRFRILADKDKCISCNGCTSVCHQGIDVMNFANKGQPMQDPQCVRCSACVQVCPTGVLSFGQVDPKTGAVLEADKLAASRVQMMEPGPTPPKTQSRIEAINV